MRFFFFQNLPYNKRYWNNNISFSLRTPRSRLSIANMLDFESQSRQEDFSLFQNVTTGSGALPVSQYVGIRVISSGVKRQQREVNHSLPRHAEVRNERSYTSTPPICLHCVDRLFFVLCSHNSKHFKVWCLYWRYLSNDMASKGKTWREKT